MLVDVANSGKTKILESYATAPKAVGYEDSLSSLLRKSTKQVHTKAERTGIIQEIIRGRPELTSYLCLLKSLFPIYQKMEQLLEKHKDIHYLSAFAVPAMYRAGALNNDIQCIEENCLGLNMAQVSAINKEYVARLDYIEETQNLELLIAHIYVRYLGDLSGGQILERILSKHSGLENALSFYQFPKIKDLAQFKNKLRAAIDDSSCFVNNENIIKEALAVFELNISLSSDVDKVK